MNVRQDLKPGDICSLRRDIYYGAGYVAKAYNRVQVMIVGPASVIGEGQVQVEGPNVPSVVLDTKELLRLSPGPPEGRRFELTWETPLAVLTLVGCAIMWTAIAILAARMLNPMHELYLLLSMAMWTLTVTAFGIWRLSVGTTMQKFPLLPGLLIVIFGLMGVVGLFRASNTASVAPKVASAGLLVAVVGIGVSTLIYFFKGSLKRCAVCGSPIREGAVKCKSCGSFLTTGKPSEAS